MKRINPGLLLCGLLLLSLFSCQSPSSLKKLDRRISLWRKDKRPYGTQLAYDGLSYLFPGSEISVNRKPPSDLHSEDGKKAYIIISPSIRAETADINAILNLVGEGNQVFLSARWFSDSLLHALHLRTAWGRQNGDEPDSLKLSLSQPITHRLFSYAYPGDAYDTWITSMDTTYTTVLGRNEWGYPNFVRFNYKGGGRLYLQFAPLAFSNFFILHKDNRGYYENALSYIPSSVQEVWWDEYFRYGHTTSFSPIRYILSNPSLQWAFWLLLLLFALIYLFDSKRRQRTVPIIPALRNTSVDFVRTIGQLYYQRRDNRNLVGKMIAHFQDQVRTRYNLPVASFDENFTERLSYKAGYPKESLQQLVVSMNEMSEKNDVTDPELLLLHELLDQFYKST